MFAKSQQLLEALGNFILCPFFLEVHTMLSICNKEMDCKKIYAAIMMAFKGYALVFIHLQ